MFLIREAIANWSNNGFFSYLNLGSVSLDRCEARSILLACSKLGTEEAMRHEKALQQARRTGFDHWIGKGKDDACSNEAIFTNDILRIDQ